MEQKTRSKYADYIAAAIRSVQQESGLTFPEGTILITKTYNELSGINEIIGLKVFVCNIPSPYDFYIAFPSEHEKYYKLQKYFQEYLDTYDLTFEE